LESGPALINSAPAPEKRTRAQALLHFFLSKSHRKFLDEQPLISETQSIPRGFFVDNFIEFRRMMSIDLCAASASGGPLFSRRAFMALSASMPVVGAADVRAASLVTDDILYDETFFEIRHGGRSWRVERGYFDETSGFTVSVEALGYRIDIPRLRLRGTNILGRLEIWLTKQNLDDYELECSFEPFAVSARCSLKQWLNGDWTPADLSPSLRTALEQCSIVLEPRATVSINKNFDILINGEAHGDFWGAVADCQSILVRTVSPDPHAGEYPSIELQGAICRGTTFLPSDAFIEIDDFKDSTVRYRWHSNRSSSITVFPSTQGTSAALFLAIKTAGQGTLRMRLGEFYLFRSQSKGALLEGIYGRLADDAGIALWSDFQFRLSSSKETPPLYAEFVNGDPSAFHCQPIVVSSRVNVPDCQTDFRLLPTPYALNLVGPSAAMVQLPQELEDAPGIRHTVAFESDNCTSQTIAGFIRCGIQNSGNLNGIRFFSTQLLRSEDLLSLGFDFYNCQLERTKNGTVIKRTSGPGFATIVVHFPPQHIEEAAFPEDLGCADQPIQTGLPQLIDHQISDASRLVFELPDQISSIPLTAEGLLDWSSWRVRVGPPRKNPSHFTPPEWNETAIELPTGIVSQPAPDAQWTTSSFDRRSTRHVLFHAALAIDPPFGAGKDAYVPTAPVTPTWTPDFIQCGIDDSQANKPWYKLVCRRLGLGFSESQNAESVDRSTIYLRALEPKDKRNIVRLSYDGTLCPTPVQAEYLLLSTLGGWAHLEGSWPANEARQSAKLDLDRWEHIISHGRDQRVVIVRRFLLFPFGHRITFVRETVRKIEAKDGKFFAVLRTKEYTQRRQETVSFADLMPEVQNGILQRANAKKLPFRFITLTEPRSPNLDDPRTPSAYTITIAAQPKNADGTSFMLGHDQLFWPTRCGQPVKFKFEAVDWLGNTQVFEAPIILVDDVLDPNGDSKAFISGLASYYNDQSERFCSLGGQTVALAASTDKQSTEVQGLTIGLGADYNPLPRATGDRCAPFDYGDQQLSAPFYPFLTAVKISLPALAKASPNGGGVGWVALVDPDANDDAAEIFAVAAKMEEIHASGDTLGSFQLAFHQNASSSGGVAAPTPNINSISRPHGIYGLSPAQIAIKRGSGVPAAAGALPTLQTADPLSFFLGDANVLGIKLAPLLTEMAVGAAAEVPILSDFLIENGDAPDVTGFSYDWSTTQLKQWPGGNDGFQFVPTANTSFTIGAGVKLEITDGATVEGFVDGMLNDFTLQLVFGGNGIAVPFRRVRFVAPLGRKPEFDVDIDIQRIAFVGPLLQFVDQLKEWLSVLKPDSLGFDIDVRPDGVSIVAPPIDLPDIEVGVVSIEDISINNRCDLHFIGGKPITFQFAFCTRDEPFLITVYALGGRGHFLIEIDANGITLIEASLEFGAFKEISFGGVAKGYIYASGGIFFSSKTALITAPDGGTYRQTSVSLVIFVHVGGGVTALGFISVSVDIGLSLAVTKQGSQTYAYGTANVSYSVKIAFIKKDFTITYTTTIAGSKTSEGAHAEFVAFAATNPPSPARFSIEKISVSEFETYWAAFA
jgi:hypothetical protein